MDTTEATPFNQMVKKLEDADRVPASNPDLVGATKPARVSQVIAGYEAYNDGKIDTKAEHRGITKLQKLKMGIGVLASSAALFGTANLIGTAVDGNSERIDAENGNTPELVQNQIQENAIQTAVANGENPADVVATPSSEAPSGEYADLQAGIEAQTADNAVQSAVANGENPANTIK